MLALWRHFLSLLLSFLDRDFYTRTESLSCRSFGLYPFSFSHISNSTQVFHINCCCSLMYSLLLAVSSWLSLVNLIETMKIYLPFSQLISYLLSWWALSKSLRGLVFFRMKQKGYYTPMGIKTKYLVMIFLRLTPSVSWS